ncbi:MAG: molybdenum ABC transporter ATP-binding protein [Pseudomonadales bacterium]
MNQLTIDIDVPRTLYDVCVRTEIPLEGVTAVMGPSGAGKTTLLRCIAGLERRGRIDVRMGSETWQGEGTFVPPHVRPVSMVFQSTQLFEHLDVAGNLRFAVERGKGRRGAAIELDRAVELLGLASLLGQRPDALSGGQRQRVAIARSLLAPARILLMDEPLASLDVPARREILPYLRTLCEELALPIVYVSHDLDEIMAIAARMLVIEQGRLLASGPVEELSTRLDLAMSHERQATSVMRGRVRHIDEQYGLAVASLEGAENALLHLTTTSSHVGASINVRIAARDVSIARTRPEATSILNCLAGTIEQIDLDEPWFAMIRIRVGHQHLLARITRKSLDDLELRAGDCVFALVKSAAFWN